ncbi:ATP-dependent DNA helicase PIF1 [Lentinula edodes]|uniref:ATP-dependent DNA helicase n=1 Tax=Lentinula edodes TaxID=5353 RepID=A0A1Q3ET62_LENED|nr:ATP-dependent DNA helicase PIF1 [Lentinula edodes]
MRGDGLEDYNILSYFCDTYEQHLSKSHDNDSEESARASVRHRYKDDFRPKHGRVVRLEGHETMPQFVGRWFPRNDRTEDRLLYKLMMMAVLKPWRKLSDLVVGFRTVDEAWDVFMDQSAQKFDMFLENVQYFYHCSDQSASRQEKEYATYEPAEKDKQHIEVDIEDEDDNGVIVAEEALWTEEDILGAQEIEKGHEERFGVTAMEHAFDAGIFQRHYEFDPSVPLAKRCTALDKVQYEEWVDVLKDYASKGVVVVNDNLDDIGSVNGHPSLPGVEPATDPPGTGEGEPRLRDILNTEQKLFHDIVEDHLHATVRGLKPTQMLMILRGPGGTGKTVAINALTETFKNMGFEPQLAKTATSGVAATLISGRTVHTWAGLSIGGPRGENWVEGSVYTAQKRLANIGPVEYLIIDEVSMATKDLLANLSDIVTHVRSKLDKPGEGLYFGGMNVILCGDFHQFPPVANGEAALYHPKCTGKHAQKGQEIYSCFDKVVTLRQQMRVRDKRWQELLDRLRTGSCTREDIEVLHGLRLDIPDNPKPDFQGPEWSKAVLITPRNSARKRWNASAVRQHCAVNKTRLYSCPAEDTAKGSPLSTNQRMSVAKKTTKHTGNLAHRVEVAIGMKAMVLLNIATEADLANGTRGVVEGIVLDDREDANPTVVDGVTMLKYPPAAVFFRPSGKTNVKIDGVEDGLLPIIPTEASFTIVLTDGSRRTVNRRQVALTPGYAFTDYKGQGQTLEYVIVDMEKPCGGPDINPFSAYVALSRSRGRGTIRLLRGFEEKHFVTHPSAALREEDERLDFSTVHTERWWNEGRRYTM